MGEELIRAIGQAAEARGTRSTVLHPLLWAISLLAMAFVGSLMRETPTWARIVLATLLAAVVVMAMCVYWIAFQRDPDLLRSEKYALRKMEIQQAAMGDDMMGEIELPAADAPPALTEGTA